MARKPSTKQTPTREMLQVPAYITKVETTQDRGVKIIIHTQELTPEAGRAVFALKDRYGYMLFKEGKVEQDDLLNIPDEVKPMRGEKTPSKRQRDLLFILWQKEGKQGDFELYYKSKMDSLCDRIKERIKEYE